MSTKPDRNPGIDYNRLQMSAALRDPEDLNHVLKKWLIGGMHTVSEDYPGISAPSCTR